MIAAGTAFGFGLFIRPIQHRVLPRSFTDSLVGLLGFKHDRALAQRALAVTRISWHASFNCGTTSLTAYSVTAAHGFDRCESVY
ncbi:hypothetical protein C8R44DRAFT_810914 [Mycena epipterygia]|nr:hypothetical protein C8R44DRAFT_810914 [Mycena epipterygia]